MGVMHFSTARSSAASKHCWEDMGRPIRGESSLRTAAREGGADAAVQASSTDGGTTTVPAGMHGL